MKSTSLIVFLCFLYTTARADEWSVQSKPGDAKLECTGEKGVGGFIFTQQQSSSSSSQSSSSNSSSSQTGPSGSGSSSSSQSSQSSQSMQYSKMSVRLFCASSEQSGSQNATSSSSSSNTKSNGESRQEFSFKQGCKTDDKAVNCDGDTYICGMEGRADGDDFK